MDIVEFLKARLDEDEFFATAARLPTKSRVRMRREARAKRKILDIHEGVHSCGFSDYSEARPCPTLRALAAVHSDHPSYDNSWGMP